MDGETIPIVYVNGKRHCLPPGRAESTLLQYLRELGYTGAKLGCGEGGCGACTVMVSSQDADGTLLHRSVNACLCPLYSVEGTHVITVEGIGSVRNGMHPVQERLAKAHGSQCGYCTPGFVMSMYALLRTKNGAPISEEEIEEALAGNLCRCTGYRPILDAFRPFATAQPEHYMSEKLKQENGGVDLYGKVGVPPVCPSTGQPCSCSEGGCCAPVTVAANGGVSADPGTSNGPAGKGTEPIFPPELLQRKAPELTLPGKVSTWHRPLALPSVLKLKAMHPEAKLIVGNTEVGIEMNLKAAKYPVLISTTHIPELNAVREEPYGVWIGASVTLTRLLDTCRKLASTVSPHASSTLRAIAEQLRWFAGPSIRNAASLGGNICTASPISDLNPLLIAAQATFVAASFDWGQRTIPAGDFFLGYRQVDLKPDEILVGVRLPWTKQFEYVKEFKQAHRREDDIAIVNAGIRLQLEISSRSGRWTIADSTLAFGGVGPCAVVAFKTAETLNGRVFDQSCVAPALEALSEDIIIAPNAPGGMVEYRRSLAASFLFKSLIHAAVALESDAPAEQPFSYPYPERFRSVSQPYTRPLPHGLQYFSAVPDEEVVGQPHRHMAADIQVTGEAVYVDDMPLPPGTLHAAVVLATRPHARVLSINLDPALAIPGVAGAFTATDIPGKNDIGAVIHDEELFATNLVTCMGQLLGIVVGETEAAARSGARAVVVEYEDLPAVFDIDDALAAGAFYEGWGHEVKCGDVESALATSQYVVEGEVRMGGQEHFYLEPNAHLVVPGEGGEITCYSSTQCPEKHQRYIAHALGLPVHKVNVRTKRLGGGFGGKETRAAFLNAAAAVPAHLLNRPVRLVLDRGDDMAITGHRHPFMARYRVGFSADGRFAGWDIDFYSNAGNSLDLSHSIMDRALMSCDSVYHIPAVQARGHICRTNLPSNTAFRGFGGPQGMMTMEHVIDKIARSLGKDPEEIRALNMYREGDVTPYGMILEGCQARACWEGAIESAGGLNARRSAVKAFNKEHRFRKRGIVAVPTKFGISFTTKFLNQAGALVHIYQADGTVLVTHGGVEMGQGLHTKVCQIVAQALGVPLHDVHIGETATDKVPNSSPTAASASSDMYGAAAADACAQLNARLAPFRGRLPSTASLKEIAQAAYLERVDLSAHGFYATPDITGFGGDRPFNYLTYGAAVTEVELDVLTGDWQALRADIVMDVGQSLNPAIDVGQVEGAFVQGMGWSCIEELVWGDSEHRWVRPGTLFTRGPGAYKIPTANDIPIDMRVTLLRNAPCARTPMVHSSKAVGEPPFFLGTSVFWALKDAVYAAREEVGCSGWFQLDAPATPERLRMACVDDMMARYAPEDFRPKLSC